MDQVRTTPEADLKALKSEAGQQVAMLLVGVDSSSSQGIERRVTSLLEKAKGMSETSRRKLLAGAGAGVAVGTVGLTMGPAHAASSEAKPHAAGARESVVAYVEDHRSGQLRLLVGEREVVVHDRDLVTRILNAAGGK